MRFSDGRIRIATGRLALMRRVWAHFPATTLESSQALAAYDGGDVLDIGAFHGWYSVLLGPKANGGDRLVSFEPDPNATPVLTAMLRDLGRHFPAVTFSLITQPVGDGHGVAESWPEGEMSHPRFADSDAAGSTPSLAIDEFVSAQGLLPRLVKVDVEGAELAVLRGMRQTLSEHRPTLLLEIHPLWQPDGVGAADVEAFVRDAGYDGRTFDDSSSSHRQIWQPRSTGDSTPRL
jgi:FkbM family methyltransferase